MASLSLDEAVLRAPAVLWTVLGLAAAYVLGRELVSRRVGLVAAALLAFSTEHVAYGQEMRPYAALLLLFPLANVLLLRALRHGGRTRWTLALAVMGVGVWWHA
jgi:uncharacterized membrane protein